jgi:hypothetical protein
MTATLATSCGWPRRRTGTLAAIARPGSVVFSSSKSVLFVHVLQGLVSMMGASHVCPETHVDFGVGIMSVNPIIAGRI